MVLDQDAPIVGDLGVQLLLVPQPPHQRAGAPVDEALRQRSCSASDSLSSMARVRSCQCCGIVEPVRPVRDERPGADVGDAVRQRVDVAVGAVGDAPPAWRTSPPGCARSSLMTEAVERRRRARRGSAGEILR